MIRPTQVKALEKYRIWVRFSDGIAGELDLSDLAGRGLFTAWDEPGCFDKVHVTEHRSIAWSEDLEICPDAVY